MSDYDKTTERRAEEFYAPARMKGEMREAEAAAFHEGRNSAKESLEILARALNMESLRAFHSGDEYAQRNINGAIAAVKARGDWPLEPPSGERGSGG